MQINELCHLLEMPKEVHEQVVTIENVLDFNRINNEITQMNNPNTWEKEREELTAFLAPDEKGLKILTCQLHAVCHTYEKYRDMGISDEVFIQTMKFFSRFLYTYKKTHGEYKYVWAWWAVRQISMQEFRIGELEYEMMTKDDKKVINIHIPSDVNLTSSNLKKSYLDAREFFEKFFPEYANVEMICGSWLLAPALKSLLLEGSRILEFQKSFVVTGKEDNTQGILDWVYGRRDLPFENLPEETSLQRKLKKYLLDGGKVDWTNGTLVSNPF
ncbi:acyltransferase domain-containing protein [Saliterribacillus persicus]|uniref:GNAT-like C-terminal domain-containing protein n=1 Tax=Saliterribacillus persicus TaxID=930114 RepID=A0A368X802_9BACI|nr:acyltransferase domain-containing protein [Saliterribacillus persicus]RCW63945.1 hypothetical protein DFR57_11570 [Saliterribacillus persicus]